MKIPILKLFYLIVQVISILEDSMGVIITIRNHSLLSCLIVDLLLGRVKLDITLELLRPLDYPYLIVVIYFKHIRIFMVLAILQVKDILYKFLPALVLVLEEPNIHGLQYFIKVQDQHGVVHKVTPTFEECILIPEEEYMF